MRAAPRGQRASARRRLVDPRREDARDHDAAREQESPDRSRPADGAVVLAPPRALSRGPEPPSAQRPAHWPCFLPAVFPLPTGAGSFFSHWRSPPMTFPAISVGKVPVFSKTCTLPPDLVLEEAVLAALDDLDVPADRVRPGDETEAGPLLELHVASDRRASRGRTGRRCPRSRGSRGRPRHRFRR